VANGRHPEASPQCVRECVRRLEGIHHDGRIVIDDAWRILREYRQNLSESGQPGVGDRFLKWLLQNNANPERCVKVALTVIDENAQEYEEFPDSIGFAGFDPSDRKFVAVANAHPNKPPILQAVDSKWKSFNPAFLGAGISVDFLC
jgi:hypothetical protein